MRYNMLDPGNKHAVEDMDYCRGFFDDQAATYLTSSFNAAQRSFVPLNGWRCDRSLYVLQLNDVRISLSGRRNWKTLPRL